MDHVHGYVVRDWKQIPLSLTLERVVEAGTSIYLTSVIGNAAHAYEGLSKHEIEEGLITFGAYGVSTFPSAKSGITVQLVNKHALFMVGIHYVAHHTNLVVQTLSDFEVVKHVEDLLETLYSYSKSLQFV